MKNVLIGILVFVIGYMIIGIFANYEGGKIELSYYAAIAFSLVYLASVITVCTGFIVSALKKYSNIQ
ncbi:hypothetical protein N780_17460 [Pontibacillus chungwhensis BH030062]|uniref:Uncharacterized protein n=1 Tax=Pontibacillus chungwhensis BH030062 TaxID=1385513 RepID=A0A0A2UWB6_9BACI|nr:hypothetical protein N780_17460 [Pontibacillus chungwhensis BH030062]